MKLALATLVGCVLLLGFSTETDEGLDTRNICQGDGYTWQTTQDVCSSWDATTVGQMQVRVGAPVQQSWDSCDNSDGWGDKDCYLANRYGAAFLGTINKEEQHG